MGRGLCLLLGLPDWADSQDIKRQYRRLVSFLSDYEQCCDYKHQKLLRQAREKLSLCYESYKAPGVERHSVPIPVKSWAREIEDLASQPKIGQILVSCGAITLEQLDEALEAQRSEEPHEPLGKILVDRKLISASQLAYFLNLQVMLDLSDSDWPREVAQLQALGLLTADQVWIARIDQTTRRCSIREVIVDRGWVDQQVLEGLAWKTTLPSPAITA